MSTITETKKEISILKERIDELKGKKQTYQIIHQIEVRERILQDLNYYLNQEIEIAWMNGRVHQIFLG